MEVATPAATGPATGGGVDGFGCPTAAADRQAVPQSPLLDEHPTATTAAAAAAAAAASAVAASRHGSFSAVGAGAPELRAAVHAVSPNATAASAAAASAAAASSAALRPADDVSAKHDLQALAESCDRMRAAVLQCMDAVQAMARELEYNKSNALFKAEQTFESALAALRERKEHVIDEILRASAVKADSYGRRLAGLSARLHELTAAKETIATAAAGSTGGAGGDGDAGSSAAPGASVAADARALSAAVHARLCGGDDPLDATSLGGDGFHENCHLDFVEASDAEVRRLMTHLGSVAVSEVSTELTTASGEGLRRCTVGKPTVVHVTLRNKDGAIVHENCLEALIYKENLSVQPQISLNEHGSYDVVYIVPEPGSYTLSVGLFKQQIRGSPFKVKATGRAAKSGKSAGYVVSVKCKPPAATLGGGFGGDHRRRRQDERPRAASGGGVGGRSAPSSLGAGGSTSSSQGRASASAASSSSIPLPERSDGSGKSSSGSPAAWSDLVNVIGCRGRGAGEFANPQGVCVSADQGGIVVADSSNQSVQAFSRAGRLLRRLAERGRVGGQLLRPTGVAVTRLGSYVVADYENKCVNLYSAEWKFIKRLGHGRLLGPKGVAVTPSGEIVVADNKANAVLVFNTAGKLLRRLGEGTGAGSNKEWQLAGPHYVACTADGDVLVTDFHSHSVKCFDGAGQFAWSFGSNGNGNGQFDGPTGVAVDERGNIVVADWGNSRIQVFDRTGSFISHVNTEGSSLFGPQDVAVFSDGTVVVSDSGNHCVKLFKYS